MTIDWFTFLAQVVNFLVLVYLLKRFLYAPVTAAMEAREVRYAEQFAAAERSQQDAQRLVDEYQQRKDELEHARHQLFEEAKQEVDVSRQQLLKQARRDVENRREDWLASLHREQETLAQMVKQRCGDQVTAATRQAIRHLADADLEEQMLRAFIEKLTDTKDEQQLGLGDSETHATAYSAFAVPPIWRQRIRDALQQRYPVKQLDFRVDPAIVCGLEVHLGSQKIGWSVEEYLAKLEEQIDRLVQQPIP